MSFVFEPAKLKIDGSRGDAYYAGIRLPKKYSSPTDAKANDLVIPTHQDGCLSKAYGQLTRVKTAEEKAANENFVEIIRVDESGKNTTNILGACDCGDFKHLAFFGSLVKGEIIPIVNLQTAAPTKEITPTNMISDIRNFIKRLVYTPADKALADAGLEDPKGVRTLLGTEMMLDLLWNANREDLAKKAEAYLADEKAKK